MREFPAIGSMTASRVKGLVEAIIALIGNFPEARVAELKEKFLKPRARAKNIQDIESSWSELLVLALPEHFEVVKKAADFVVRSNRKRFGKDFIDLRVHQSLVDNVKNRFAGLPDAHLYGALAREAVDAAVRSFLKIDENLPVKKGEKPSGEKTAKGHADNLPEQIKAWIKEDKDRLLMSLNKLSIVVRMAIEELSVPEYREKLVYGVIGAEGKALSEKVREKMLQEGAYRVVEEYLKRYPGVDVVEIAKVPERVDNLIRNQIAKSSDLGACMPWGMMRFAVRDIAKKMSEPAEVTDLVAFARKHEKKRANGR